MLGAVNSLSGVTPDKLLAVYLCIMIYIFIVHACACMHGHSTP